MSRHVFLQFCEVDGDHYDSDDDRNEGDGGQVDDNEGEDDHLNFVLCEIRRTNDYMAPWMTEMITPRLCEDLLQKIEGTAPQTAVSPLMIAYTNCA